MIWMSSRTAPFTTVRVRGQLKLLSGNMSHSENSVCAEIHMCVLLLQNVLVTVRVSVLLWCVCREHTDECGVTVQATSEDGHKDIFINSAVLTHMNRE